MEKLCAMFSLFSIEHFLYIILAVAICLALVLVLRKFDDKKKMIRIILVSLMGLFVVLEYVGRIISVDKFNFFNNLPINAFQVFTIVSLIMLIKNTYGWTKFSYLIILPVSVISIIFIPNFYTTLGSFSLSLLCFVFVNILLIIFAVLNAIWCEDDIYHKDVIDSIITFVIFVASAHIINVFLRFTAWGLQADYFGTMAEGYNMYIGWISALIPVPFVCHLPLIALLVGVVYLLKLPFDVFKTKREHREQMEELVALGNLKAQQKYRESQRKSSSHILVRNKPNGDSSKSATNLSKEDFVKTHKEVQTNNEDK